MTRERFGPQPDDHQIHVPCAACGKPFLKGCYTTLIPLGPGEDPEAQARCREGRPYNAVAAILHWECATGEIVHASDEQLGGGHA